MGIGPGPNLAGSLFTAVATPTAAMADSNGAVTSSGCTDPGGGDDGGGGDTCDASGGSGGGNSNNNGGDTFFTDGYHPMPGQGGPYYRQEYPLDDGPQCPPTSGLPPGTGCVRPDTRISLFPEGCLAAAEVKAGDLLLTRTPEGALAGERVSGVRRSTQPCLLIETQDGRRLHVSLSHEIMVADDMLLQGRKIAVSELTLSHRLLDEEGNPLVISALSLQPEAEVVQISLEGPHHLYLSGGVWSHNKWIPAWPAPF